MKTEFTNWHFSLMASYNGDWLSAFYVLLSAYQVSCSLASQLHCTAPRLAKLQLKLVPYWSSGLFEKYSFCSIITCSLL